LLIFISVIKFSFIKLNNNDINLLLQLLIYKLYEQKNRDVLKININIF